MRLWQKVFIVTLTLVTLAINTISFVLLKKNHQAMLSAAQNSATQTYEVVNTAIESGISAKRTELSALFLTTDTVLAELPGIIAPLQNNQVFIDVSLFDDGYYSVDTLTETVRTYNMELVKDAQSAYYIKTDTLMIIEGKPYCLSIIKNITEIFDTYSKNVSYIQRIGSMIAIGIAAILLLLILIILKPLKQMNNATKEIANGNYTKRINIKGNSELTELAFNMNVMTEKIETNVNHIEQLAQEREIFIANMTHELKTPLTSILGFADILKIKADITEKERREYAAIIVEETKRLRILSSKLMELITLGTSELDLIEENVELVLAEIAEGLQPLLQHKGLTLHCSMQPSSIMMDKALFKSLIFNLFDNAIKASAPGQTLELEMDTANGKVAITLQDHGMGIPQDSIAHVTEPFYMVDKARSRKAGGSGIGLSLCKAVTQAHKGVFKIESSPGQGTCVTLIFPSAHIRGYGK